jgi:hypothetical protein
MDTSKAVIADRPPGVQQRKYVAAGLARASPQVNHTQIHCRVLRDPRYRAARSGAWWAGSRCRGPLRLDALLGEFLASGTATAVRRETAGTGGSLPNASSLHAASARARIRNVSICVADAETPDSQVMACPKGAHLRIAAIPSGRDREELPSSLQATPAGAGGGTGTPLGYSSLGER